MKPITKLKNILVDEFTAKQRKEVREVINFDEKKPQEVLSDIIRRMIKVAKSKDQRNMIDNLDELLDDTSDEEIVGAFNSLDCDECGFTDENVQWLLSEVFRNDEGEFKMRNKTKVDGRRKDESIIIGKIGQDAFKELTKQEYKPPYDGVFKKLAPVLQPVKVMSSFHIDDPHGYFVREGQLYNNVCFEMPKVDPAKVTERGRRLFALLLWIVSGGTVKGMELLYAIIHNMVRVPDSPKGHLLYLNDFNAGGAGKSKFVRVLQYMFGDTFTTFTARQTRFTRTLLGKRLVSIPEERGSLDNDELINLMKTMTGRDKMSYEGKGVDPVDAETYQHIVIVSNDYHIFDDNALERRLQNFHSSTLLVRLKNSVGSPSYLDSVFGKESTSEKTCVELEMAHSALDMILNDNTEYTIPERKQDIILTSLRNPILLKLHQFVGSLDDSGLISDSKSGCKLRLANCVSGNLGDQHVMSQLCYAARTIQKWLPDISFYIPLDNLYMECDLPKEVFARRLSDRITEIVDVSSKAMNKNRVELELGTFHGIDLLGLFEDCFKGTCLEYGIKYEVKDNILTVR